MTVEYLKTPSSIYGAQGGVVIDRAPVVYSPCTTAEVNHARLPETEDLRSMQLAYREQYYTDRQLAHFAGLRLQMIFWGSLFLAVAAVLSGPFLPFEIGAGIAASLSFILTLSVVTKRTATTPLSIICWFAAPLLAFVLLKLFVVLVVFRTFGTILLSLFTVLMYLFVGHRPFEFYRQWLYTHPRLKPETRAHPRTIRLRPSMFVLIGILLITVFVPLFSPTLAILGVIVFCLAAIGRDLRPLALLRSLKATIVELPAHLRRAKTFYDQVVKSGRPVRHGSVVGERDVFISTAHTGTGKTDPPLEHPGSGPVPARSVSQHPAVSTQTPREAVQRMRTLMQRVKAVFGQYLTYGLGSTDAPGVWLPPQPLRGRRATVWLLVTPLFITLTIGLNLFCPWDLLKSKFARDFGSEMVPRLYDAPHNWIYPTAEGVIAASEGEVAQHGVYLWLFPLSLALAMIVPVLVLAALYRPPLKAADELRTEIDRDDGEGLDDDGRTEWQWYVDRIRTSPHEAVDQLCETVREAEHLFLGIEPNAQFPLFLHKDILSEHCYIVGDTGSGKTSRGIMPILMQLIRGHVKPAPPEPDGADQEHPAASDQAPQLPASAPVSDQEPARARPSEAQGDDSSSDRPRAPLAARSVTHRTDAGLELFDPYTPPPPVVVLDLKGDNALFQTVKHEAEQRRNAAGITDPQNPQYAFRYFTPEKDMASYYFNPFQSFESEARTDIQLAHLFLDALNLNHGEGYGRSYYSRKNRMLLFDALTTEPKPKSIEELAERLKRLTRKKGDPERLIGEHEHGQDTFELVSTIHALAQYEMLATTANVEKPERSIHMPELIEHRQVAYFWLPAALESISVREIAKLALFCLLTAAIDRQRATREQRQVYLVIDEFQRIAGENFKVILEQARSFGLSAILANQTQSDLQTHDIDLRPTIRTNTRAKMYFGVSDPDEVRTLAHASGDEVAMVQSYQWGASEKGGASWSRGYSETMKNRLTQNDIKAVTDHPLEFIFEVSRGSGYTQFAGMPMVCRTTYPLHLDDYKRREETAWPKKGKHTVRPSKSPEEADAQARDRMREELGDLFAQAGA